MNSTNGIYAYISISYRWAGVFLLPSDPSSKTKWPLFVADTHVYCCTDLCTSRCTNFDHTNNQFTFCAFFNSSTCLWSHKNGSLFFFFSLLRHIYLFSYSHAKWHLVQYMHCILKHFVPESVTSECTKAALINTLSPPRPPACLPVCTLWARLCGSHHFVFSQLIALQNMPF